jgi:hypothetical protein
LDFALLFGIDQNRKCGFGPPNPKIENPARVPLIQNPKSKIENRKWGRTMKEQEFKARTKQIALRTVRVVEALLPTKTADVIAKLGVVEEEADESVHKFELLIEAGAIPARRLNPLNRGVQRNPGHDRCVAENAASE